MPAVLLFVLLAAVCWGLVYARGASLTLTALGALLVGYVFGHAFWNVHIGPVPITLDRLMLVAIAGLLLWRLRVGGLSVGRVGGLEWALGAVLVWLTLSTLVSRPAAGVELPTSPVWRLLFSFWAPAFLFLVARLAGDGARVARPLLITLSLLGAYLAVTAIAESAGFWGAVFPRYIADPELGLHFGRARGPALNSVSLGVHLTVCFWAAWLLIPRVPRWTQLTLVLLLPALAAAVLLTYTRSAWLGLAASGAAVLLLQAPRRYRAAVLAGVAAAGVVAAPVAATKLLSLDRGEAGGAARHSVQQRTAFAYVSWKMFCDHPIAGVGFGRFYDQKLPYLSDRTQSFELESLRDLHHHNTLLSVLTETGMVGLVAYLGLLYAILHASWRLARAQSASDGARRLGVLSVATLAAYLSSALFHDLTLVHNDQWLLFLIAGAAVGCERTLGWAPAPATRSAPALHGAQSPA